MYVSDLQQKKLHYCDTIVILALLHALPRRFTVSPRQYCQDNIAKTILPRQYCQDNIAKIISPRQYRQDITAKTTSPRQYRYTWGPKYIITEAAEAVWFRTTRKRIHLTQSTNVLAHTRSRARRLRLARLWPQYKPASKNHRKNTSTCTHTKEYRANDTAAITTLCITCLLYTSPSPRD